MIANAHILEEHSMNAYQLDCELPENRHNKELDLYIGRGKPLSPVQFRKVFPILHVSNRRPEFAF